jgi:uncharacterized protein YecE (DUF72 family)
MFFERERFAAKLRQLADQGVFIGTSSWKYPGWFGTIYERDRYIWRGSFSQARFERDCLREYAETFPAVSVDATYYKFYDRPFLQALAAQTPERFQFALKVCGDITIKQFPQLPRFGELAGALNPRFLDANVFVESFLSPCEGVRPKLGLIMFEFSRFGPGEFHRGAEFVQALDGFLGKLPRGWPYGVELRNRNWMRPEYFAVLARHQVTHVYNAWTDVPSVAEQRTLRGSETNPGLLGARFLLREGRSYDEAVKRFSPYTEIKDANPSGRAAAAELIKRGLASKGTSKVFVLVNNRFEGNAPATITAILDQADLQN